MVQDQLADPRGAVCQRWLGKRLPHVMTRHGARGAETQTMHTSVFQRTPPPSLQLPAPRRLNRHTYRQPPLEIFPHLEIKTFTPSGKPLAFHTLHTHTLLLLLQLRWKMEVIKRKAPQWSLCSFLSKLIVAIDSGISQCKYTLLNRLHALRSVRRTISIWENTSPVFIAPGSGCFNFYSKDEGLLSH